MSNQLSALQKKHGGVAKGSISDMAARRGKKVAQVIADVDAIILFDYSGSMNAVVYPDKYHSEWDIPFTERSEMKTRWEHAVDALRTVQQRFDGKVMILQFSTTSEWVFDGVPDKPSSATELANALEKAKEFDGTDIEFIIISDGQPSVPDVCRRMVREFKDKVSTIFIGNPGGEGEQLMHDLAHLGGGMDVGQTSAHLLGDKITKLLGDGS